MSTFLDYERRLREELFTQWPLIADVLGWQDLCLAWQMQYQERIALISVVSALKPACAIEIGTHSGGSLAVLSRFAGQVHSLDINPESSGFLADRFGNVRFAVGDSRQTLPPILAQWQQAQTGPTFILVDGDHSAAGVCADFTSVLAFRPLYPTLVMGHDSFNPECRRGMLDADWGANPHVHLVEIDFVPGTISNQPSIKGEMWGGLSLAVLLPETRNGHLQISRREQYMYDLTYRTSPHRPASLVRQVWRRVRQLPGF